MNCAKCATPRKKTGDIKLDYTPQIRLLKIGESNGEEKFACPRCRAIFWFPKAPEHQQNFLAALA